MTPTFIKELLPILQAFSEGKKIEHYVVGRWEPLESFDVFKAPSSFRIKPEPKWRPWKPSEVPKVFVVAPKDKPACSGMWQVAVRCENPRWVVIIDGYGCVSNRGASHNQIELISLLGAYVQVNPDGETFTPCGVPETP